MAGCSLDRSPGSNWVEKEGGLPEYFCEVARAIARGGRDLQSAIRIAIGRVEDWAVGKGKVNPDTRAKAAKAVAQWEAMRARRRAKGAKGAAQVAASCVEIDELRLALTPAEEARVISEVQVVRNPYAQIGAATDRLVALAGDGGNPFAKKKTGDKLPPSVPAAGFNLFGVAKRLAAKGVDPTPAAVAQAMPKLSPAQVASCIKLMKRFGKGGNGSGGNGKVAASAETAPGVLALRAFSTAERDRLASAKQPKAMPGGGYPIENTSDLKNAIQAFGRAKDKVAAKAWIKKRARELNATNLLPEGW